MCAELIRDFLEYYKLDYTLSIYMPEVNLNNSNVMSKEEISHKVGLEGGAEQNKPLLVQILEGFMSGERSHSQSANNLKGNS